MQPDEFALVLFTDGFLSEKEKGTVGERRPFLFKVGFDDLVQLNFHSVIGGAAGAGGLWH
jgi:hypothetical protein